MDSKKKSFIGSVVQAIICMNCWSDNQLELQDKQVQCQECNTTYEFVDGVLDLMPLNYSGYQGDSMEAAILRDEHNRQTLREDTTHLQRMFNQFLRPESLILDVGCGTGHLAKIISESHPDVTIIATDVSLPMCQLAAKNCRDQRVMVIRTATTKVPPMPFRSLMFDVVLNRLAPMHPEEAFRLLLTGGFTIEAGWGGSHWKELKKIFPDDRIISFPRNMEPMQALLQAGFSKAESHEWRSFKRRSLNEIITMLKFSPTLRDFDEVLDQPFLDVFEELHGNKDGIQITEGELLIIGWK